MYAMCTCAARGGRIYRPNTRSQLVTNDGVPMMKSRCVHHGATILLVYDRHQHTEMGGRGEAKRNDGSNARRKKGGRRRRWHVSSTSCSQRIHTVTPSSPPSPPLHFAHFSRIGALCNSATRSKTMWGKPIAPPGE